MYAYIHIYVYTCMFVRVILVSLPPRDNRITSLLELHAANLGEPVTSGLNYRDNESENSKQPLFDNAITPRHRKWHRYYIQHANLSHISRIIENTINLRIYFVCVIFIRLISCEIIAKYRCYWLVMLCR